MDFASLAFALGLALLTGVIFGLAPALQAFGAPVHEYLKDTGRGSTAGRNAGWFGCAGYRRIGFACVLLVGAGLLIRSFLRVLEVDPRFRPENAATVRIDPPKQYNTQPLLIGYFNEALRRVKSIPGVSAAGVSDNLPLGGNRSWGAGAKGVTYPRGQYPNAFVRVVSDGYFAAMGVPLRAGRDFTQRDDPDNPPVIVINESLARTLWPGQDPLGRTMRACGDRAVVGVVSDVKHLAFEQASGNELLADPACSAMGSAQPGGSQHAEYGRPDLRH